MNECACRGDRYWLLLVVVTDGWESPDVGARN